MKRSNQIYGLLLIAVGIFLFLLNLGVFKFSLATFWPLFLLVPGLLFHFFYFTTGQSGLLIPGGLLTTYGVLFLFTELAGYDWMEKLWPVFILGPGIGLLEMYLFGERHVGLLIPALILLSIGTFFLVITILGTFIPYIIGILLIVLGVFLLFNKGVKKENRF